MISTDLQFSVQPIHRYTTKANLIDLAFSNRKFQFNWCVCVCVELIET